MQKNWLTRFRFSLKWILFQSITQATWPIKLFCRSQHVQTMAVPWGGQRMGGIFQTTVCRPWRSDQTYRPIHPPKCHQQQPEYCWRRHFCRRQPLLNGSCIMCCPSASIVSGITGSWPTAIPEPTLKPSVRSWQRLQIKSFRQRQFLHSERQWCFFLNTLHPIPRRLDVPISALKGGVWDVRILTFALFQS